jgi:diguanylate cyclase (GGDEF)-like protein
MPFCAIHSIARIAEAYLEKRVSMDHLELRTFPNKKLTPAKKALLFAALLAVILLIGLLDYATGAELAFSIFYLFPVGIAAWYLGWEAGISLSIVSAIAWYVADALARMEPYENYFIPAWNTGVRLMTFLIVTVLITILRATLEREAIFARIDPLTGASNSRAFYETAEILISLLKRHQRSFTILYLDIDDFKQLNDTHGHSAGDSALQTLVSILRRNLRVADTITRFGGDEFAVLLSDADAGAAEIVSSRIQSAIRETLPFTCSMGVLTCSSPPGSVDELVEKVDNLMYEAKRNGKDTKMSSTLTSD